MYLYILNGPDEGKRITLEPGTCTIGRAPENRIVIGSDQYVSSVHAEISSDGTRVTLADRGSRNGTFLLGESVTSAVPVPMGDIFRVGRTFLKLSRRAEERIFTDEQEVSRHPETILVIDIVGSAKIAQAMGDHVAGTFKNHLDDRMKHRLEQHTPLYRKNTGDGFMVIFPKPVTAVQFAIDLLHDLRGDETPAGFHVRIGINYGETAVLEDGDRRGSAVDMAFRVESVRMHDMHQTILGIRKQDLPRVDRIFITEIVQQLIANRPTIASRCIGYFDLKGFNGRHKVFEVLP